MIQCISKFVKWNRFQYINRWFLCCFIFFATRWQQTNSNHTSNIEFWPAFAFAFVFRIHKLIIIDMYRYTEKFKWMADPFQCILLIFNNGMHFSIKHIRSNIYISHISAQSSLTSGLPFVVGCCAVKMHGMQYTSHALKLIDWHFNNCLWMKYWGIQKKNRISILIKKKWQKCIRQIQIGSIVWMDSSTNVKYKFKINFEFFVVSNTKWKKKLRINKYFNFPANRNRFHLLWSPRFF